MSFVPVHNALLASSTISNSPKHLRCFFSSTILTHGLRRNPHRNARNIRLNSSTSTSVAAIPSSLLINPPTSTLPPSLDTPTRLPSQSLPSHYYALGKSYLKFYKTGLKAVWTNHKAAQSVRTSLKSSATSSLSRADFQLLRRSRADAQRIPLFLLLFIVCGEFTPLVVAFFGAVVPRTCKVPAQIASERQKMEDRRRRSFRDGIPVPSEQSKERTVISPLSREQALHCGRTLGLYGQIWDYVGGLPGTFLRRRINAWIEYINRDDKLMDEGGGAAALSEEEVRLACQDRGIDSLNRTEDELKATLSAWFKNRKKHVAVTRLLLSRPNMW